MDRAVDLHAMWKLLGEQGGRTQCWLSLIHSSGVGQVHPSLLCTELSPTGRALWLKEKKVGKPPHSKSPITKISTLCCLLAHHVTSRPEALDGILPQQMLLYIFFLKY